MLFHLVTSLLIFSLVGICSYLLGRTDEQRKKLNIEYLAWKDLIKTAEQRRSGIMFSNCDDTMLDHAFCLRCAVRTLDDMRYTIPRHVWAKGFKAYDWLGHFEKVYTPKHKSHLAEKPH